MRYFSKSVHKVFKWNLRGVASHVMDDVAASLTSGALTLIEEE